MKGIAIKQKSSSEETKMVTATMATNKTRSLNRAYPVLLRPQ
jgi:hypothetical protein